MSSQSAYDHSKATGFKDLFLLPRVSAGSLFLLAKWIVLRCEPLLLFGTLVVESLQGRHAGLLLPADSGCQQAGGTLSEILHLRLLEPHESCEFKPNHVRARS